MLIVADGMGGHQAGEVASKMASEIISHEYFKLNGSDSIEKNLSKAFRIANTKIFEMASSDIAYQGMGTTCTALAVVEQAVYYAHVGDSRAYMLKNNSISRITEDHTYVQELVNLGELTADEADTHPKEIFLQMPWEPNPICVWIRENINFHFEKNDRLLLCSDGLYDYLVDEELNEILKNNTLQDAVSYMVGEAKKRGGHDNITVVLAEKSEPRKEITSKETRDIVLPVTKEYDLP